MPRKPRILLDGYAVHIVQRGVDRAATFFDYVDYLAYLNYLKEASDLYGIDVHAYCLMTNHVHLLVTPASAADLPLAMKRTTQLYVQHINKVYRRSGPLWEGRYKASIVGSDRYLLSCYRYIELNPVRARMVEGPSDYRWSSHRVNACDQISSLVTPHPTYLSLGIDDKRRATAYVELFDTSLDAKALDKIRVCTQQGYPVGDSKFVEQIGQMLDRKLVIRPRGRPSNQRKGV